MEYYRPYFTADEICYLIECIKQHDEPEAIGIYGKLRKLAAKIDAGLVNTAYSTNSLMAKLGAHEDTPVKKREQLYLKFTNNKLPFPSPEQMELIKTYLWEIGKITDEDYEQLSFWQIIGKLE